MTLRFAIIATAEQVWPVYQSVSTAEKAQAAVIMVEPPARGEEIASMVSVPIVSTLEEVWVAPGVDAVYLALPQGAQEEAIRQAIRAGKHILLEAPWQAPLDEATALWAEAQARGIALGIAAPWAVDATMVAARTLVRAGILGEILSWRADHLVQTSGDPLSLALPLVDLYHWLAGATADQVCAMRAVDAAGREEIVVLTVTYKDGCLASLQLGTGVAGEEEKSGPILIGSLGQLDLTDEPRIYRTRSSEDAPAYTWTPVRYLGPRGSRERAVAEFAAHVAAGQTPPFSAGETLEALRILETARRSLAEGHPCQVMESR